MSNSSVIQSCALCPCNTTTVPWFQFAEENLKTVWLGIAYWYKELGVDNKFAQLKPTMFSTKSSPKLKGKAGEVKDLVPVLHKVLLSHHNPGLENH